MNYLLPLGTIVAVYSSISRTLHKRSKIISDATHQPKYFENDVTNKAGFHDSSTSVEDTEAAEAPVFQLNDHSVDSTSFSNPGSGITPSGTKGKTILKRRKALDSRARDSVLKTSFYIALCYLCCHTINQIFYLMFSLRLIELEKYSPLFYARFILVYLHSSFNPLIYCIRLDTFKEGMVWIVKNKLKKILLKRFSIQSN